MIKLRLIALMLVVGLLFPISNAKADEGMWLPMFIKGFNYQDMKARGLKLTPEDIYSINNSSLKDAIVRLGPGFCTGEIISDQGLMLTNHHCGYGVIQEKSSVENDYLTDGFWAMKKEDELPAGFSVSFLVRMEDVSERINSELNEEMTLSERSAKIKEISNKIEEEAKGDTELETVVKAFFSGNEFYLFVYETFPDVRLVGAPPSAVGKFGGDTDNWMWPRHTGDFTLFRVYADKDNNPAAYSKDNKPYKPKHFLPISMDGVQHEDYAMIFGYPGSTDRYLTSHGVQRATETEQPARVAIRRAKLDIYEKYQAQDNAVRIMYASKHARVSNYWKYFMGQTRGLKRLKVYEKKKAEEDAFEKWIQIDPSLQQMYGNVMNDFKMGYEIFDDYNLPRTYFQEAIYGIEALQLASGFRAFSTALNEKNTEKISFMSEQLKERVERHFKDYHEPIDREVMAAMFKFYYQDIDPQFQPEDFVNLVNKNKEDFERMANRIMDKSIFASKEKTMNFINNPKAKTLSKDPVFQLMEAFFDVYFGKINERMKEGAEYLERADRLYVKGMREMNFNKKYYPNANSTMRVTYGRVLDYYPADAVYYNYFTTAEGILEKEDPNNPEFVVPEDLKNLLKAKDYGPYTNAEGELVVCFISDNDITGGNSGSPVINAKGELIGTAFDGNWEAMSGDIAFEPELQRTISVDIRYTLFIIDKLAGAKHLIDEMKLVKAPKVEAAPAPQLEKEMQNVPVKK